MKWHLHPYYNRTLIHQKQRDMARKLLNGEKAHGLVDHVLTLNQVLTHELIVIVELYQVIEAVNDTAVLRTILTGSVVGACIVA